MARKTIKVETIKNRVNKMLAESTCSPKERRAMAMVLDGILHETGNYKGFRYLQINDEYRKAHKTALDNCSLSDELRGRFLGDESRIEYF